jgi:hypothetical protein
MRIMMNSWEISMINSTQDFLLQLKFGSDLPDQN